MNSNAFQFFNMSPNDYDKVQMDWYRLMRLTVWLDLCCFESGNECQIVPERVVWLSVAPRCGEQTCLIPPGCKSPFPQGSMMIHCSSETYCPYCPLFSCPFFFVTYFTELIAM